MVAVTALLVTAVSSIARLFTPSPSSVAPAAPEPQVISELLRTNGAVFSGALNEATGRADKAVAERERLGALLEQCRSDVKARDEYLIAAAPEVRALQEQLREAQDTLLRVEAYFGATAMAQAQRYRGWLGSSLGMGSGGRPSAQRVIAYG